MRKPILLFLFFSILFQAEAQNLDTGLNFVDSIAFKGLKRTKAKYLQKFFPRDKNGVCDSLTLATGIQQLRNLQLFSHVGTQNIEGNGGQVLEVEVQEKLALLPIFNFDYSEVQNRWSLGFADYNAFGNASIVKAAFHHYDFNSFEFFFSNPNFYKNKYGLQLELQNANTLEPVYFETASSMYRFEKWITGLTLVREFSPTQQLYVGGLFLKETYLKQTAEGPGENRLDFNKSLFKIRHEINKVNYFYQYQDGWRNTFGAEMTYTPLINDVFWKLVNDFKVFKKLGAQSYLAGKFFIGLSKNDPTPFPAFVQDNYVNVRGVGNRVMRGSAEISASVEWRISHLDKKHFVLEQVFFVDAAALRFAGRPYSINSLEENFESFGGTGFRIHLKRIFQAILRVDMSADLSGKRKGPAFIVGLGQFF